MNEDRTTVADFKRVMEEMKDAHPYGDNAEMYVSRANPEYHQVLVIMQNINGVTLEMRKTVVHTEENK